MTRREQTIVEMLTRWREALEGGSTTGAEVGYDSRAFELPPTWTWAYRELERLLLLMRSLGRQQAVQYKPGRTIPLGTAYWHVQEWYIDAEPRPAPVMRQVTRAGRKAWVADPVQRRIIYRRHPDAREEKALAGVRWLAAAWSDRREPELPREFLVARPTPKLPCGELAPDLTAPSPAATITRGSFEARPQPDDYRARLEMRS